ncbi:aminotransferase class I/II-fold pyridoxal phosphate-dependent enzyme [Streptomyces sp. SID3343]|uniref:pyridoxal phosphate-dependent decarboxylase family protein n=1 Tax=Streptomyces sp. SID3343 TaxID=2690260 RepID=UPI0013693167|nr:aminotransferase class I/II-fold pyridoxal phosphate-dependent enzyme [Streptomyces sp. SID3343]MYW01918.1 aminotransferase class V-fold PLP-dependent enzyme [Streptomyces sp. SID3343]
MDSRRRLTEAFDTVSAWADTHAGPPSDSLPSAADEHVERQFAALADRMRGGGNRSSAQPAYTGYALKPPHAAAVAGHLATVLIDSDGSVTDADVTAADLEEEIVAELASMLGLPDAVGHLTSGATVGNLRALWVAREIHPELGIAHSADTYSAHERMCELLRTPSRSVPVDAAGRMDPDALATELAKERVGTVVVTVGTPTLGAVDPVADIVTLCRDHGVRVHVDAAYGGFFALVSDAHELRDTPTARHLRAVADSDSVVVDAHEHGLHVHGCGAVLFRDTGVGGAARHDARAVDFGSEALRAGDLGLDAERFDTAALWLTLRALPLTPGGLGESLAAALRDARRWRELIDGEAELMLYQEPELDILTYLALTGETRPRLSSVEAASRHILHAGAHTTGHPVHLSTLPVRVLDFLRRHPHSVADQNRTQILRSVLSAPEPESHVDLLHARVAALAATAPR